MSEFFQISPRDLQAVRKSECWSIENMEGHDAGNRRTEYIGSRIEDSGKVWDYYMDDQGRFWYRTRWRVDGKIISMERYMGIDKKRKRHRE